MLCYHKLTNVLCYAMLCYHKLTNVLCYATASSLTCYAMLCYFKLTNVLCYATSSSLRAGLPPPESPKSHTHTHIQTHSHTHIHTYAHIHTSTHCTSPPHHWGAPRLGDGTTSLCHLHHPVGPYHPLAWFLLPLLCRCYSTVSVFS